MTVSLNSGIDQSVFICLFMSRFQFSSGRLMEEQFVFRLWYVAARRQHDVSFTKLLQ